MSQTQKEKGRSRRKTVKYHHWAVIRQFMAFFLTFSMIFGNVGNSVTIAMAAQRAEKKNSGCMLMIFKGSRRCFEQWSGGRSPGHWRER